MSDLPEVQRALRAAEGIAHARVVWPDPEGPAHLTVSFVDGADRAAVTREVLEVLERVGRVDLDTLEIRLDDDTGDAPFSPEPERERWTEPRDRLVFDGLSVERSELDTAITVLLQWRGRSLSGWASGLSSPRQTPRIVAEATVAALREVVPSTARVQLEWAEVVDVGGARPGIVQAAVTLLTREGEVTHVGSALVRGDVRETAARATLDAVNRRLGRMISVGERLAAAP